MTRQRLEEMGKFIEIDLKGSRITANVYMEPNIMKIGQASSPSKYAAGTDGHLGSHLGF